MKGLAERIAGRDSVSGIIQKVGILGVAEASEDGNLLTIKFTMDSGCSVFVLSTKDGLEAILERKERTATFVGEFLDGNRTTLNCDEVYFWDTLSET